MSEHVQSLVERCSLLYFIYLFIFYFAVGAKVGCCFDFAFARGQGSRDKSQRSDVCIYSSRCGDGAIHLYGGREMLMLTAANPFIGRVEPKERSCMCRMIFRRVCRSPKKHVDMLTALEVQRAPTYICSLTSVNRS